MPRRRNTSQCRHLCTRTFLSEANISGPTARALRDVQILNPAVGDNGYALWRNPEDVEAARKWKAERTR